ncbi:SPFH domain-containing protein [Streptomyces sp. NPDC007100]|uniref:SPFH domain-containing protein n=1 Tax=Streptomyces sp. NPDC007100 TaxID=3155602 RepID=UPI0033E1766E
MATKTETADNDPGTAENGAGGGAAADTGTADTGAGDVAATGAGAGPEQAGGGPVGDAVEEGEARGEPARTEPEAEPEPEPEPAPEQVQEAKTGRPAPAADADPASGPVFGPEPDPDSATGPEAPARPSLWSARSRTIGHGAGIRMDLLFRAEPEADEAASTRTGGELDFAKGPRRPNGGEPATPPADAAFNEADTTEQPRITAPLLPPEARLTPADAAVAGIAAATDLLDTAERAALDGALGVVDAGSRARTEGTAADRHAGRAADATAAGRSALLRELSRSAARRAPDEEDGLAERRGRSLSGWLALFLGLLAIACSVAFLWWRGMLPAPVVRTLGLPIAVRPSPHPWEWAVAGLGGLAALYAFGGLSRGRVGSAWVLSLFGRYRGSVRRTGLVWISPLVLRRRVDVRLRHWRSEAMPAVDAQGIQLRVVVLVVWRVRDTARALFAVQDHTAYLREQVESAMARVLSQLPADAYYEEAPTLRDAEAVGEALTRALSADCRPVGIEVFSAQPTRIEYAPEVAAAMQRRQIAAIDAKHRDSVLTSVVDAVDDTVQRLTSRGLVELDDYERKALVKDLTVAFYTARGSAAAKS